MIGIRVDANQKIAMGHVMRCLSIAKQLRTRGEDVKFWISGNYAADFIRENGFACVCMDYEYDQKESEADTLIGALKKAGIEKLLLDSYEVTYKYMEKLQSHFRIIYVDDMNAFRYPADMIINYTHDVMIRAYEPWNYTEDTVFLMGSRYVPLRPEFGADTIDCTRPVERILITTGGADEQNMILPLLERMSREEYSAIQKLVIAGKFYAYMEELQKRAQSDSTIQIYQNVSNMHELMMQSNLAISAGGTTLAELSSCGIPTICFAVADNQLYGTKAYAKDGIMKYAGDVRDDKDTVLRRIMEMTGELINDSGARQKLGGKAKEIIDGKGAARIAENILQM